MENYRKYKSWYHILGVKIMAKGKIVFKLDKVLKSQKVAKYKLHTTTGIPYDTILKYCKGEIKRIPIEHLIMFCDVLDCKIEDIIEYKK